MTLPSSKTIGDTGHVSDHNAITAHIAAHEANVTDAHDIDGLIETHRADTTDVHGIADTSKITGAWTSWTPVFTSGITSGGGSAAYRLVGKTLEFRLLINTGTVTSLPIVVTLPASLSAIIKQYVHCIWEYPNSSNPSQGLESYVSGTSLTLKEDTGSALSGINMATYNCNVRGTIEVS